MYRAKSDDIDRIMDFVSLEPEFNIFTIGDLEQFGLDNDKCKVFLHAENDTIKALILLYHTYLTLYLRDTEIDMQPITNQLNVLINEGATALSGKKTLIEAAQPAIAKKAKSVSNHYFAKSSPFTPIHGLSDQSVEYATHEDAVEIIALFDKIPEFQGNNDVGEFAQTIKDGTRKTTLLKVDDKIVSTASSVAETNDSAMIIGVATEPDERYRKRGYASACVFRLVKDLKKKGKSACLFYDNPAAGSIYKKMGFQNIGFWKMIRF